MKQTFGVREYKTTVTAESIQVIGLTKKWTGYKEFYEYHAELQLTRYVQSYLSYDQIYSNITVRITQAEYEEFKKQLEK